MIGSLIDTSNTSMTKRGLFLALFFWVANQLLTSKSGSWFFSLLGSEESANVIEIKQSWAMQGLTLSLVIMMLIYAARLLSASTTILHESLKTYFENTLNEYQLKQYGDVMISDKSDPATKQELQRRGDQMAIRISKSFLFDERNASFDIKQNAVSHHLVRFFADILAPYAIITMTCMFFIKSDNEYLLHKQLVALLSSILFLLCTGNLLTVLRRQARWFRKAKLTN